MSSLLLEELPPDVPRSFPGVRSLSCGGLTRLRLTDGSNPLKDDPYNDITYTAADFTWATFLDSATFPALTALRLEMCAPVQPGDTDEPEAACRPPRSLRSSLTLTSSPKASCLTPLRRRPGTL
jgi:hypothetical protein